MRTEYGVQGCKTDEQTAYGVLRRQIDPYNRLKTVISDTSYLPYGVIMPLRDKQ